MATLRADGRYAAMKRVNRKQIYVYGRTEEEAEEKLRMKIKKPTRSSSSHGIDLNTFAWRDWYPRLEQKAPKTITKYVGAYRHHISRQIGHLPLSRLDPTILQIWISNLGKQGLSPKSVHFCRDLLGQIIKRALYYGHLDKNPLGLVELPKMPRKREREMSFETARKLLEVVDGTNMSAPVFLAVRLGLRRGEIAGLKKSDYDPESGFLSINRQRQAISKQGVVERDLKSATSHRKLSVSPILWAELLRRANTEGEFVCTKDGKPWVPDTITEHWNKLRVAAGLLDWTFHDLRHAHASLCMRAGCDVFDIQKMLGHANPDMTAAYAHKGRQDSVAAMERLNANFGE